jgi:hypothetical protein
VTRMGTQQQVHAASSTNMRVCKSTSHVSHLARPFLHRGPYPDAPKTIFTWPEPWPLPHASPPRLHFPRLAASPTQPYDASTRTCKCYRLELPRPLPPSTTNTTATRLSQTPWPQTSLPTRTFPRAHASCPHHPRAWPPHAHRSTAHATSSRRPHARTNSTITSAPMQNLQTSSALHGPRPSPRPPLLAADRAKTSTCSRRRWAGG